MIFVSVETANEGYGRNQVLRMKPTIPVERLFIERERNLGLPRFTTRLALVFASWADENIIRIETVQDAFVASLQRIFFLFDFEQTSQQLLKVPKAPKSTFRYVWGIHGNRAMAALNHPLFGEAAPLIRREIFPSMYKRNLRKEKGIENISNAV